MEDDVAPTDSRRRPDQRLMEIGDWDQSNRIKVQLEEKQRAFRKQQEAEAEEALKREMIHKHQLKFTGLCLHMPKDEPATFMSSIRARSGQSNHHGNPGFMYLNQISKYLSTDNTVKFLAEEIAAIPRTRRSEIRALLCTSCLPDDDSNREEPPCHKPMWFDKQKDEITGNMIYIYNDKYWTCKEKKDWTGCPDIFL